MKKFDFIANGFKTNRSYDNDFSPIPQTSGVYLLMNRTLKNGKSKYDILYVGSSNNLKERLGNHEVYRFLNKMYLDVVPYFKIESNYLEKEKELIKLLQPKFNTQWL